MNSLRDLLVQKGAATKKDARRVDRQLKHARRTQQGHKGKRRAAERAAAEARAAEEADRRLQRAQAKVARERARDAHERAHRVRQVAQANAVRARGGQAFWVRSGHAGCLTRLRVAERVAFKLRAGELGVVRTLAVPGWPSELVVVGPKAVAKLHEIAPECVVFFVTDTAGISAPEEAFLAPDWDVSLVPHRQP